MEIRETNSKNEVMKNAPVTFIEFYQEEAAPPEGSRKDPPPPPRKAGKGPKSPPGLLGSFTYKYYWIDIGIG